MSGSIPERTWRHNGLHARSLAIEKVAPAETEAVLRIRDEDTTYCLSITLNPDQLDEIADDFHARAAAMRGAR